MIVKIKLFNELPLYDNFILKVISLVMKTLNIKLDGYCYRRIRKHILFLQF